MLNNREGSPFLSLVIEDEDVLYRHYMPFIASGGLFINRLAGHYPLGARLFITLRLPAGSETLAFVAKVVWLAAGPGIPVGKCGIGVQIEDEEGTIKTRLENLIIARLDSGDPTLTL